MAWKNSYSYVKNLAWRTLLIWIFSVIFVASCGPSEAVVQLRPRVNSSGAILKDDGGVKIAGEDYVIWGKYKHRFMNGAYETTATPVLWRVMSADAAMGGQKKVILLTHFLVDFMRYNAILNNTWDGSAVQLWVNSSAMGGFLEDFSVSERDAMPSPSLDGLSGTKATLASFWKADASFNAWDWVYGGELYSWFGGNDMGVGGGSFGPNSQARRAHYKDAGITYDSTDLGFRYWTRSPVSFDVGLAWYARDDGALGLNAATGFAAVRPACFLDLNSILFKSASNDFAPDFPSSVGSSSVNPYILVLPNVPPNGLPVAYASADKAPVIAKIDGKNLVLEWETAISPAVTKWPAPEDFTLSNGESPIKVTGDNANKNVLHLTFKTGVKYADPVRISYNLNTDAISFDSTGNPIKVVNSFLSFVVSNDTLPVPSTPNVTPTQARFDGLSPEDLKFLLSGAALSAANAGTLTMAVDTPSGMRISLATGNYSLESRNLRVFKAFLSQLEDGRHTLILYRGNVQVGKVTLTVINSTASHASSDSSGSSGCNAGAGLDLGASSLLFGLAVLLRKKR